jgi:Peptidase inhibitor family I36
MHSWKARLALCFILAVAAAAWVAPSAVACERGNVCLYNGPNWETPERPFHDNGLQSLVPFGLNDIISSAYNNTNRWAILYQNADGSGTFFCIAPEIRRSMFGNDFNNEASAIQIFPFGSIPPCSGSR